MSGLDVEELFAAEAALRCAASKYASTYGMHLSEDRKALRVAARRYAEIARRFETSVASQGGEP